MAAEHFQWFEWFALLTGIVSGLVVSIPVGPVNISILNEGARRGFLHGVFIGAGAVTMEVTYCAMAFTGFAQFFDLPLVKATMQLVSFVFVLGLGVRFAMAKELPHTTRVEERIEKKLHPHSAYMTGFVRVMANPGTLLLWIVLAANFTSRAWVKPTWPGKLACVCGVAAGAGLWFLALSWAASLGHGRISERTLVKMERYSGYGLIALAVGHGSTIVWHLARHSQGAG